MIAVRRTKFLNFFLKLGTLISIFFAIVIGRLILKEQIFSVSFFGDYVAYTVIWFFVLFLADYFNLKKLNRRRGFFKNVIISFFFALIITLAIRFFQQKNFDYWSHNLIKNVIVFLVLSFFLYFLKIIIVKQKIRNVIIVGGGFSARAVARELYSAKHLKLNIVGFVSNQNDEDMIICAGDEVKEDKQHFLGKLKYLGKEKMLSKVVEENDINYIVLAKDRRMNKMLLRQLDSVRHKILRIYFIDEIFELLSQKLPVLHLDKDYFYYIFREIKKENEKKRLYVFVNRLVNVFFSFIGIILSAPIMIISAVIIKLESKGPVFFVQNRVGLNGKEFKIVKFRSMKLHDEEKYSKYAGEKDDRITRFGKFMRKTRIDELPQFFNIIKGDMNFVGPRAEWNKLCYGYMKEIPFYNIRHDVKPGVTGWAQVNYPYGASVEDALYKLQYDLYYIKNRSFLLDFIIILKTISTVLFAKGR